MPRPQRPPQPADQALLDRLRQRGYVIDDSDDIQALLDHQRANAATFLQRDLLLRRDPRQVEVLEEYLHNVQYRLGLYERMTIRELELHVKEFMLRHPKLLGLIDADLRWLVDWLQEADRSR